MSLITRRRAVYTALAAYFAGDELASFLVLWESRYAGQPSLALSEFICEVVKRSESKLEATRLYRELIAVMSGPSSALLADPGVPVAPVSKGGRRVAALGPDAAARPTFEALSELLFSQVPTHQLGALRRFASENLRNMPIEAALRLRLRGWLEQGGALPQIALELEHLRQLLSLIYIGLCEFLGPVPADQLLSQAVQQVELLHLTVPPQRLL